MVKIIETEFYDMAGLSNTIKIEKQNKKAVLDDKHHLDKSNNNDNINSSNNKKNDICSKKIMQKIIASNKSN